MLKLVTLLRYFESVITSSVEAVGEVKELKERLSLLQDKKSALEKAKQVETDDLKKQLQSRDKQLDESWALILELEKACAESAKATNKAKAEVVHVEQLWAQSAHEILNNLLEQCQVICPDANFSEVGLDKIVIDGCIEVAPDDDNEGVRDPEFDRVDPMNDP